MSAFYSCQRFIPSARFAKFCRWSMLVFLLSLPLSLPTPVIPFSSLSPAAATPFLIPTLSYLPSTLILPLPFSSASLPIFATSHNPAMGWGSAVSFPSGVLGGAVVAETFLGVKISSQKIAFVGGHLCFQDTVIAIKLSKPLVGPCWSSFTISGLFFFHWGQPSVLGVETPTPEKLSLDYRIWGFYYIKHIKINFKEKR